MSGAWSPDGPQLSWRRGRGHGDDMQWFGSYPPPCMRSRGAHEGDCDLLAGFCSRHKGFSDRMSSLSFCPCGGLGPPRPAP